MSQLMIDRSSTLVLTPSRTTLAGVWEGVRRIDDPERSNVLLVVYGHGPATVRDAWFDYIDEAPARLGVVGVGVSDRETDGGAVSREGGDVLTGVRDPVDVADLGIAISLYLQEWAADDTPTILGFHSLTSMLDHVGVETAFRFLHVLNHRLASTDTTGQFYLDPSAVDEPTIGTLRPVFERVIERDRPTDERLSPDVAFDLVGAARRRYALYHLFESGHETSIETLVAAVARREGTDDHERVELSLRHTHLPKMEEAGLISLRSERVVVRGSLAAIEPYLSPAVEDDLPGEEPPF